MPVIQRMRPVFVVLAVFLALLLAGVLWGGFGRVMAHGIVICLDCIGVF